MSKNQKDYVVRPEYQEIQKIKIAILDAFKIGKKYTYGNVEGVEQFCYENGKYHYLYKEHLGEFKTEFSHESDAKALEFMFKEVSSWYRKISSELEVWKEALQRLQ